MHPWPPARVMEGQSVRLEPLSLEHAAGLFAAAADPETFRYMLWTPEPWGVEGFEELVRQRHVTGVPFAVVDQKSGEAIGVSSYLDIREEHLALEIGYTWYGPKWRGTVVNPECKLLMLGYAFDELGCVRVQLKCDDRNERSKAAILKLGAKFEGVLRNQVLLSDGHRRRTAYFSILPEEWEEVRAGLVERISRF